MTERKISSWCSNCHVVLHGGFEDQRHNRVPAAGHALTINCDWVTVTPVGSDVGIAGSGSLGRFRLVLSLKPLQPASIEAVNGARRSAIKATRSRFTDDTTTRTRRSLQYCSFNREICITMFRRSLGTHSGQFMVNQDLMAEWSAKDVLSSLNQAP